MTPTPADLALVLRRLDALERHNRRLTRLATALAVLLGCGALLAANYAPPRSLETQSLIIKDEKGKTRGKIEATTEAGIVQTFYDESDKERVRLAVDAAGATRLWLMDDKGATRVAAYTFASDHKASPSRAGLTILGPGADRKIESKEGIQLAVDKNGQAAQTIYDKSGKARVWLGADATRTAYLSFYNTDGGGEGSIQLGTGVDQTAYYQLFGSNGKRSYLVHTDKDNATGQYFFDKNGRTRAYTGVTSSNGAAITLSDDAARERFSLNVFTTGIANFRQSDKDGKLRGLTYTAADGEYGKMIFDKDGHDRIFQGTLPTGLAAQNLLDRKGKIRASSVVFNDGESSFLLYDANGKLRFNTTTFANGRIAQTFTSPAGVTKASTVVAGDGSLSTYSERNAAQKAWEATGNVLQFIDLMERLSGKRNK